MVLAPSTSRRVADRDPAPPARRSDRSASARPNPRLRAALSRITLACGPAVGPADGSRSSRCASCDQPIARATAARRWSPAQLRRATAAQDAGPLRRRDHAGGLAGRGGASATVTERAATGGFERRCGGAGTACATAGAAAGRRQLRTGLGSSALRATGGSIAAAAIVWLGPAAHARVRLRGRPQGAAPFRRGPRRPPRPGPADASDAAKLA